MNEELNRLTNSMKSHMTGKVWRDLVKRYHYLLDDTAYLLTAFDAASVAALEYLLAVMDDDTVAEFCSMVEPYEFKHFMAYQIL